MEEIDDFVDTWHESKNKIPLHEFLGMTWEEYALWVADPNVLPFIVTAHKEGQDIENLLEQLKTLPLAARAEHPKKAIELMKWLKQRGELP